MVVPGVMYNECILPVRQDTQKQNTQKTDGQSPNPPTPMQRQGHMRDAVRRPVRRCTQSELGDQLQRAQAEQSASSLFHRQ